MYDEDLEETLLAEYLIKQVTDKASGACDNMCLHNLPHDVYFIGSLRPFSPAAAPNQPEHWRELENKLAPFAFGADFLAQARGSTFVAKVKLSWSCFYRVLPTFIQQQSLQNVENLDSVTTSEDLVEAKLPIDNEKPSNIKISEDDGLFDIEEQLIEQEKEDERALMESPEIEETPLDRRQTRRATDALFISFRRIACILEIELEFQKSDDGTWSIDEAKEKLEIAVREEIERAKSEAVTDPECLRLVGDSWEKIRVSSEALESEQAFKKAFQRGKPVVAEWKWDIELNVSYYDENTLYVQFGFGNASPMQNPLDKADSSKPLNPNLEPFFFNTQADFEFFQADIQPFILDIAPQGFRYDRYFYGRGFNCAIESDQERKIFRTTHAPLHRQMRYSTRNEPKAKFAELAINPIPVLRKIITAMEDFVGVWDTERDQYIERQDNWKVLHGDEFDQDKITFLEEIESFRKGVKFIEEDDDIRLAFQLVNKTFQGVGEHPTNPKDAWRLFQIVFLVGQIPGIAALRNKDPLLIKERETVDIIYFPTGGGKTEAYLGTLVFHCFFDRLRGKTAGVTAWTRFPLRLLTLQQTQRVADVIGMAELVRRGNKDQRLSGRNIAAFAVGYFVGKEATPNEIYDISKYRYESKADAETTWSQANDERVRQSWKRLVECPSCRTKSVIVKFDEQRIRLFHECTNSNCKFPGGRIPIYVVDNEIYRYLPCVLVGTIDKLAGVGNQRKMAQIFGQVDGKCEVHGYYKGKCCQKECTNKRLTTEVPEGISGPTLFIQDELHLLSEGLGTFDSHYETFVQALLQQFGNHEPLKIIASSATVEAFERQSKHLYARPAKVFPGVGPTLKSSFYAETRDYPQRIFVGILPHNKTIFNSILELIEIYHRTVQFLKMLKSDAPNPYKGSLTPASPEWDDMIDNYQTSLTYFLANRELDSISTDLTNDTNPRLEVDGLRPLDLLTMTGNISTDDVTQALEKVERRATADENPNAVLASSMISHGVDVDRFNAMIFYGMPRKTAEYIQASSRVGRSHVGIVFDCLHPVRERDRSHYNYFSKYHDFLGQLIEPVAINRWAKFSINRTMPGLFMGFILQVLSNQSTAGNKGGSFYFRDFITKLFNSGELKEEDFIEFLSRSYGVEFPSDHAADYFRQKISEMVERHKRQIRTSSTKYVSESLIPSPMRSLRDVEESIPIELEY
jgi:hypothetical protein